jgi:hypothetical protein
LKRTFALLLTALLALSLTACGNDKNNGVVSETPGSSVNDGGVLDGGTSSGSAAGSNVTNGTDGNRVENGAPGTSANAADNNTLGLENKGAGAPSASGSKATVVPRASGTTASAVPQSRTTNNTVIRGASYGQMLRNARVHDRDGFLLDGENAVTPGAAYR